MVKLFDKMLGSPNTASLDDYVPVDFNGEDYVPEMDGVGGLGVHFANVQTNQDLLDVTDAVYAGDIVIANLDPVSGLTTERVEEKLSKVAGDVSGDVCRTPHGDLIIAPAGVNVSRKRIGQ
jgi:hypothetical protein